MKSFRPELLKMLACPDCHGSLHPDESGLQCPACKHIFQLQHGILQLYPKDQNINLLREEILFAELMRQAQKSRHKEWHQEQWIESKKEFWDIIRQTIVNSPLNLLFIGSGYDINGDTVINDHFYVHFDLIADRLDHVKNQYSKALCIAGDMHALPFHPESFDVIISADTLHQDKNQLESLLSKCTNLLKPGGQIIIEDINAWRIYPICKSKRLTRSMYYKLQNILHHIKKSGLMPQKYIDPADYLTVKNLLLKLGYHFVKAHPIKAYPYSNKYQYKIYRILSKLKPVSLYFNYHFIISAEKSHRLQE